MSQVCSACRAESADTAKFCAECGTPFARRCPSCGTPAAGGKFCAECGTPLSGAPTGAPAPPAAADPGGAAVSERRTTSVLFGDLVSFTTLSEARDPEEVRELLSAYFAVARKVVGRYGGTIEKFIGDAVMAVWGVPVAHEDDAERAVRAGLDLVAEVAALGTSVGAPGLAMRVGVVTGSVAVTLGAVNEGMVAGDAVNTAARVQSVAAPSTVWTDEVTRSLTAAAVMFSDRGEHELKGKAEPVRLFRADAVVAARGGAQRVDGLEAPLTGRDAELLRVKEVFSAVEDDGRSRLLLVQAQPGLGKSRLGWELEKYIDGLTTVVAWHRGRCLSYGEGVSYWAFAEMVRSRLGLNETDDRAAVTAKVSTGVRSVAASEAEAAWLAPRVGALLTGTAGFDRSDLFSAWATYLERVAGGKPVVLLFEDMQHADPSLLDLVEHLLETCRARLLVVVLARPELLDARPSLAASARTSVLTLDPLGAEAMGRLVDALVADLPPRAREALVARADGVPLYAMETVRSLIDRDAVVARDGRYVFDDAEHRKVDLAALAAPVSLQTLIAARLDALTPVERRTVQDASVLGLSFRRPGLLALSGTPPFELDVALLGLVRKGLIEVVPDPRSPEAGGYRFLQALVHEVAHATLSRKDRRTRHLAAADHLATEGDQDAHAPIIAQHLLDALAATADSDPDRSSIAARARALLVTAGGRAEALGAHDEALRAFSTALELDPAPDERAELLLCAARAAARGGAQSAAELAGAAREALLSVDRPLEAAAALGVLGDALLTQGRHSEVRDLLAPQVAELTERTDSDETLLDLLRPYGTALRLLGDRPGSLSTGLLTLRVAERTGEVELVVRGLTSLAIVAADEGSPTAYLALLTRSVELARRHHLPEQLARGLANLLSGLYPRDLTAALELVDETLEANRRLGIRAGMELASVNCALAQWLAGTWTALAEQTTPVLEQWSQDDSGYTGGVQYLAALALDAQGLPVPDREFPATEDPTDQHCRDMLRALRLRSDSPAEAAAVAAESLRAFTALGALEDFEVFWPPVVELQLAAGLVDDAASLLHLADPLQGGRASPLLRAQRPRLTSLVALATGGDPEAGLRSAEAAFAEYGAPFYLARTRSELGRWLLTQGRDDEASALLAHAREAFTSLGAGPSLAELDAATTGRRTTLV